MTAQTAWIKLAAERKVDISCLRPAIASSWQSCVEMNLDPYHITPVSISLSKDTIEENEVLVNVASKHLRQLYDIFQGKDYFLMLVNSEGYILSILGDKCMVSHAENIGIIPGSDENEIVRGTTAANISLKQGTPIQVFWQEHFHQAHHGLCCSAAPFFSPTGRVMGVINVANRNPATHPPQILSIVSMTAKLIESEINCRMLSEDCDKSHHRLSSFVGINQEPILFFDDEDRLVHFNKHAQKLLGADISALSKSSAADLITNYPLAKNSITTGRQWTELQFSPQLRNLRMEAQIKELSNPHIVGLGTVIILREKKLHAVTHNKRSGPRYSFHDYVHCSQEMGAVISDARIMAATDHGILLEGESGTGKEVLAQAIHNESSRRNHPFIAINCAALPRDLIQSELFGYEKGAFTGAKREGQIGKFEQANLGTIFLDEIGDMPLDVQVTLLRVLQEKTVLPIGGMQPRPIDVRVIAATNKKLLKEVDAGRFRQDLYYRLSVMRLFLPPLRERIADLWALIRHFIEMHSNGLTFEDIHFDNKTRRALEEYPWPGNIRELENAIIYILTRICDNTITLADLPPDLNTHNFEDAKLDNLQSLEFQGIRKALSQCEGNIAKTARVLGISRATLYRKMQKYGLNY